MITQTYKQGIHEIRIENAESIADAKKNGFKEGEYCRYFVDGKPIENYLLLMRFIVEETKNNQNPILNDKKALENMRKKMIEAQKNEMKKSLENLKKQYKEYNVPESVLDELDKAITKVDQFGVRVQQ